MCASYDYSAYKVCDDEYVTYKSGALKVSHFIDDLKTRQTKEGIECIKASTGYILDHGFGLLMSEFNLESDKGETPQFLPRLETLDLSFNRIQGVIQGGFLENGRGLQGLGSLLERKAFNFFDLRANQIISLSIAPHFFERLSELLKDQTCLKKIIWMNLDKLQARRSWINAFAPLEQKLESHKEFFDDVERTHEAYFQRNFVYSGRFDLMIASSGSTAELGQSASALSQWDELIGSVEGSEYSIRVLKKAAQEDKSPLRRDEKRLELGRYCYEKGDLNTALRIFLNLTIDPDVHTSVQAGAYYDLYSLYRKKDMFEESDSCYQKAFELGYKRG